MQIAFNDKNIVLVIAILFFLCFFRSILDLIVLFCREFENTCCKSFYQFCFGIDERSCLYLLRCFLILYCASQPILVTLTHLNRTMQKQGQLTILSSWKSNNKRIKCMQESILSHNITNFSHPWIFNGLSTEEQRDFYMDCSHDFHIFTIDVLYVILPFAFAISCNSMIWVHFTKSDLLNESTVWGENLDSELIWYELSYAAECFTMNTCFVFIYTSGCQYIHVLNVSILLTLIQLHFIMLARNPQDDYSANGKIETFALTFFISALLSCFVSDSVITDNITCVLLFVVHIVCYIAICCFHFAAQATFLASLVLVFRLGIVCVATGAIYVFLLTG